MPSILVIMCVCVLVDVTTVTVSYCVQWKGKCREAERNSNFIAALCRDCTYTLFWKNKEEKKKIRSVISRWRVSGRRYVRDKTKEMTSTKQTKGINTGATQTWTRVQTHTSLPSRGALSAAGSPMQTLPVGSRNNGYCRTTYHWYAMTSPPRLVWQ